MSPEGIDRIEPTDDGDGGDMGWNAEEIREMVLEHIYRRVVRCAEQSKELGDGTAAQEESDPRKPIREEPR